MRRWIVGLCLPLVVGCASQSAPDLGGLYNREAQYHGVVRNPIVVIPGILGSKLSVAIPGAEPAADGTVPMTTVWGAFGGDYADPRTPEGARQVALPLEEDGNLAARDDVQPNGVLDRLKVKLLGLPFEQRAYFWILQTLGVGGYRDEELGMSGAIDYGDEHFTCFQFPYDWRRSNAENAKALHAFLVEKKAYVEEIYREMGIEHDVKFDIVAHSMGGLLTRYYLRYGTQDLRGETPPTLDWRGAKLVERAVLIGTPNAGSVQAVTQLVEGITFSRILPSYSAALLGTMPAIYQLFPRPRHAAVVDADNPSRSLDIFDPELWKRLGWGLASPDADATLAKLLPDVSEPEERRRRGLARQRESLLEAKAFAAALDKPASPPRGLELFLFAGDAVDTVSQLGVDVGTGEIRWTKTGPGDNVVLRTSALSDERVGGEWKPFLDSPIDWRQVTFLFTDHLGLTKDPAFTDNVLYLLLEAPRRSRARE